MKKSLLRYIILTDDDADDCSLFSEALQDVNHEAKLTITHNGAKLMEVLDKTVPPPPEVIFLDLNMPYKNGFECLQEIRRNPKLSTIPVVIYSTSSNNDIVEKTYEQGANFYICKPSSYNTLKKTIEFVLSMDFNIKQPTARNEFVINMV